MPRMDIVIAGGRVAGLEALLALHGALRDGARFTLIAPDPDFSYRPLAVAEPFGLGHAHRVPLTRFAEETGAELVLDRVVAVDDEGGQARLAGGRTRAFDALLLAPGGRAVAGVEGATTWWPGGDSESYGGLLRDLEDGYAKRLAIVVPPGAVWPLPAYELALMTAGEAREMGQDDVSITVVTPEHAPLSLFGDEASEAVAEELRWAGVALHTGVVARKEGDGLVLEPSGERLDVQRVFSVPRIVGPAIDGIPFDDEGFIVADDEARVEGCRRTWAAGDGVVSPVKFGGLATHQARVPPPPSPARTLPTPASRSCTAVGSSATAHGAWPARTAPPVRRCGGRTARWPASTSRAGWRSTAWRRPPLRHRLTRASPYAGR